MTPIEIIATVFAIMILVKMLMLLTVPRTWMKFGGSLIKNKEVIIGIYLVLAGVLGYYLLQVLDIVTLFVAMITGMFLISLSLHPHFEDIYGFYKEKTVKELIKHHWLAFVVWISLAGWVLYALFLV